MDLFNVLTCLCNNSPTLTFFNFYCQSKKKDKTKQGKSLWQRVWISASYTYPAQLPNITNKINKTKKKKIYHIRKIIFIFIIYDGRSQRMLWYRDRPAWEREKKKSTVSLHISSCLSIDEEPPSVGYKNENTRAKKEFSFSFLPKRYWTYIR